jgi:hypothetical protein
MDTMFTFMLSGVDGARISDGVDAPWSPASTTFPHFASPNPNPPADVAAPAAPEEVA